MFTNLFLLSLSYIAGKIMERKGNNMDTNLEESKIFFTAGDGTAENPFIISDREGLEAVSDNLSAHYKLGADIDLLGEAFTPIGTLASPFAGSLDGDGHAVRGLKVEAKGYAGLFGKASDATFKNLRIEGAEVESTGNNTGIFAGYVTGGSIERCGVSGSVTGVSFTGGLVGQIYRGGTKVSECKMEGNVVGTEYVGGLVGELTGNVENSYVTGTVRSTTNNSYIGGLAGRSWEAVITNSYAAVQIGNGGKGLVNVYRDTKVFDSYYDAQVAGIEKSNSYSIGKLTIAFMSKEFLRSWDFENIWDIVEGETRPYLKWEGEEGREKVTDVEILGGDGTTENPYLIGTPEGFLCIPYELSAGYQMMNDIDFEGENITPIGTNSNFFTGIFNGGGYTVRNFKVSANGYAALFGYANEATIKNLRIEGGEVESSSNDAGILVGRLNNGNIEKCSVSGNITGTDNVGGLVGFLNKGNIIECRAEGEIIGQERVGVLVGYMEGNVENCWAVGSAISTENSVYTGGLVGRIWSGTIKNSYAAVSVSDGGRGLVDVYQNTQIFDSYYDIQKASVGKPNSYNIGKLTSAFTYKSFLNSWDFEKIWDIVEGETYPYLRWEGERGKRKADTGEILKGIGTEEEPYQIGTPGGFQCIPYELSASYQVISDIDFEGVNYTPIGTSKNFFCGILDGGDHVIRKLRVFAEDYVGLVGYAKEAIIKNLKIEDAEINAASHNAGILVGCLENGSIERCSVVGNVTGQDSVGGLAGQISGSNSKASECGMKGDVKGKTYVGGLIGQLSGNVENCYAIGSAISISNSSNTGGLVGRMWSGFIKNSYAAVQVNSSGKGLVDVYQAQILDSYFDMQVAGRDKSNKYNIGKLTSAFACTNFFKTWDFEKVWVLVEGETYPYFRWEKEGRKADLGEFLGGAGIEEAPYLIAAPGAFQYISYELSSAYLMENDIDLGDEICIPIGTFTEPFKGIFDGGGRTLSGLKVLTNSYAGLFGKASGAVFKNLRIDEAEIESTSSNAGILVGYLENGNIEKCSMSGNVTGTAYVGGLVGQISGNSSKVIKCRMQGSVKGTEYVGGLIGGAKGNIEDCYAMGSVFSTKNHMYTGGLIGCIQLGNIKNSYAAAQVSKNGKGLVYKYYSVQENNSYYDVQTADITNDPDKGKLTSAFTCKGFFKDWDFVETWDLVEGETYPYFKWEGETGKRKADIGEILGGAGTDEEPYRINSLGGLRCISYELSGRYLLESDIDFGGERFTPIGTSSDLFTGVLDGGCHVLRGLTVSVENYGGLFGYASGASFKDLRVEEAEVESISNYAGILVGCLENGSIERCSALGNVKGGDYVGGLAGAVRNGTNMKDCYAVGSVSSGVSKFHAGGLVGDSSSDTREYPKVLIKNCYAVVQIINRGKALEYSNTVIEDSYYDSQIAGDGIKDSCGKGKLTSAFTCKEFFENWDFERVWDVAEGETYPYLKWEGEQGKRKADNGEIIGGDGTEENPYRIRTLRGILCISCELSGNYLLVDDIELEEVSFTPIGTSVESFTGMFDGGGHAVKGLKVSVENYAGLFGIAKGATFKNIRIEEAQIGAVSNYAGILVGSLEKGTIFGCYASGDVVGNSYVGGFAGRILDSNAKVQESCVEGNITGNSYVGGLVGQLSGSIIDSYVKGSVTSSSNSNYIGGLAGYSSSSTIKNSYASAQVSNNGQGLAYVYSSTTIQNSFFDSDIAGKTSPASQARTTQQMFSMDTYAGWDMESIWEHKEGAYPLLRKIEFRRHQLFELQVYNRTWHSVIIRWAAISGVVEYELHFKGEVEKLSEPEVFIEDLVPDTDYELKIIAKLDDSIQVASQILKLRTRKISSIKGLHSTHKEEDSITLAWDQIADAKGYEVTYGENVILTDTNTCILTELNKDVPYVISVRALLADGGELISSPIVEKIYELVPQTDYAREFLTKCEGQTWFIDEVENLLNQKGKSICTVSSKDDFAAIYALNLSGRGISGQIPSAIGELYQLRYLYLADNNLSGQLPEEIKTLEHLTGQDLSGNQFTE